MVESLLVIGVHREELAFGDQVASLMDDSKFDVMRIPSGISNTQTGTGGGFYYQTEHREIYLQLHQQVKRQYRLIVDLHCGSTEQGNYAEVFSRDDRFIHCMSARLKERDWQQQVRVIKIIAELSTKNPGKPENYILPQARTWIPEKVWNDQAYRYVGLEVYLSHGRQGKPEDWAFTQQLIETIRLCDESTNDSEK